MSRSQGPASSSAAVSRRMRQTGRRDTAPELRLRSQLHRRGLRYRVDVAPGPLTRRRADVVFIRARVAVFVDGCFWHSCPEHATIPKSNRDWWVAKLEANVARDRDTDRRLQEAGWRVIRVWEHEDSGEAAERVAAVLQDRTNPEAAALEC